MALADLKGRGFAAQQLLEELAAKKELGAKVCLMRWKRRLYWSCLVLFAVFCSCLLLLSLFPVAFVVSCVITKKHQHLYFFSQVRLRIEEGQNKRARPVTVISWAHRLLTGSLYARACVCVCAPPT